MSRQRTSHYNIYSHRTPWLLVELPAAVAIQFSESSASRKTAAPSTRHVSGSFQGAIFERVVAMSLGKDGSVRFLGVRQAAENEGLAVADKLADRHTPYEEDSAAVATPTQFKWVRASMIASRKSVLEASQVLLSRSLESSIALNPIVSGKSFTCAIETCTWDLPCLNCLQESGVQRDCRIAKKASSN